MLTDLDRARRDRAVLSRIAEPGDVRLTGLVAAHGPELVVTELRARGAADSLRDAVAGRLREADPAADLDRAAAQGIRFVIPEDEEWPTALGDLEHAGVLHERGGPPVGLWVRGHLRLDEALTGAVAVVGSRSATTYGTSLAGGIAAEVAGHGHPVVSGAAFGIDQAAHRGALAVHGITVAVLACGADRVYPTAHRELLGHVADSGLIVSEAPPGCAPTRVRFLARNRLIAAMSVGTVVVEAAIRSGALNTAHWAARLSRALMGVPGPVTSAQSEGVHQLVRGRDALLVTNGADVLEAVGASGQHLVGHRSAPSGRRDGLGLEQRVVLDAVPLRRGAPAGRIARSAGVPTGVAAAVLTELGRAGFVERQGEGAEERWRQVVEGIP